MNFRPSCAPHVTMVEYGLDLGLYSGIDTRFVSCCRLMEYLTAILDVKLET